MINTNYNSSFPDQVVPDAEKATYEYGFKLVELLKVNGLETIEELMIGLTLIITTFIDLGYIQEVNNLFKNIKMNYL